MSRKPKYSKGRVGDEHGFQKADFRPAYFSDKSSSKDRPAELFRMDLISAMKLNDSEYVDREDYFEIADQWREEWQRPVQVPVNLDDVPVPIVEPVHLSLALHSESFSLPTDNLLHFKADERFDTLVHNLTHHLVAEDSNTCKYDADEQDIAWLRFFNIKIAEYGLHPLPLETFERFIETWETECHQNIAKKSGSTHQSEDDDTVCDVCWSPESEDDNEMVFCDRCDICVHQACYGISKIPDTAWLCRPCSLGLQPTCCLCNKKSGALKPTKSGTRWAHVNCALWVPEVGFGDPDSMEPIVNISKIPESRWSLICSICKISNGASIQCAVGSCKTAFHVTCAFEANLEMQELLIHNGDDVTLKAYCRKHTAQLRSGQTNKNNQIVPDKGRSTQASREAARNAEASGLKSVRADEAEANFFNLTSGVQDISNRLLVPVTIGEFVFSYWKLKRRSFGNRPLLSAVRACVVDKDRVPYSVDNPVLAALRRFIILRQDLERARNLCYLVVRREKQKRALLKAQADIYDRLPVHDGTSWHRLFTDGDAPAIMQTPSVSDLKLVIGVDSVYASNSTKESKALTTEDKYLLETTANKFCSIMNATSKTASPPKVQRVQQSPSKATTSNPKLNKIRLRLAKSPSARTASIITSLPHKKQLEAESSPVKVPQKGVRKVQKLKLKLPKADSSLFDRMKDIFEFEPEESSTSGAQIPVVPPKKRGRQPKSTQVTEATVTTSKAPPVKHRRIKVPTVVDDSQSSSSSSSSSSGDIEDTSSNDTDSSSENDSNSGDSTEDSDNDSSTSSTTDSDFVKTPPKRMRRG